MLLKKSKRRCTWCIRKTLLLLFSFVVIPVCADFLLFPGSQKKESQSFFVDGVPIDSLFSKLQTLVYHEPDLARDKTLKAIAQAIEFNQLDWEVRLLNLVGASYAIQSDYGLALEYYHKALNKATALNSYSRLADTYNNLGGIQYYARNYPEALANYLEALNYYEKGVIYDKIAAVHCNIGLLYASLKNIEKSQMHFTEALSRFNKLHIIPGQTLVLLGLSRNYIYTENYDSAFFMVDQVLDLSEPIQELYSLSTALKTKGDIYFALAEYDMALQYYSKSEGEAQHIQNKSILGEVQIGFAKTYIEMGMLDKAMQHSEQALELAQLVNDKQMIVNSHMILSSIMEKKHDFVSALEHYKIATELSDNVMDESKLHVIYNMEIQHLSKDKEIQRLEIERQNYLINQRNTMLYIIILVSLFIIVLIAAAYYFYANRVRIEQQKKINEANLRATKERSKVAFEAEIEERKQLGLELHDRVGPLLSLAKLNITALNGQENQLSDTNQKIVSNTLETVNEILKEIKQISQNMAPVVLIEKGFEAAIKNLVNRLNETDNYHVNLDMYEVDGKIEPYVEHVLYRSILESVNNILHHAKGSEINIQVIGSKEDITVMIEDNGQGFDPSALAQNKGLGMKSTRSRIESLKGNMFIDSTIGKGTIVTFIIPLQTKESN
ncbi:MAG: tetratricopeptide repeat protein [Bacteroidales bacterium]|nr:tetratricopeptide repeat protein [Bacteroidales bacterium]